MSNTDLRDIIAQSSIKAFNAGYQTGKAEGYRAGIGMAFSDRLERKAHQTNQRRAEVRIARTHENSPNPRFADSQILDFRTNARKGSK